MIIEIHGAGFKNKGAEMMLRTVKSELADRLPDFVPAIDPSYGSFEKRSALGLRQIIPLRKHVGKKRFSWYFNYQKLAASLPSNTIFRLFSGGRPASYGCVYLSEIQGFVDISGFAYSSLWGNKPARDLAQLTRYFKKKERPVILLPQAFGPFESEQIRSAFREVIANATLIFARDKESLNYLLELSPDTNKISQAPDITLFYPRKKSDHERQPLPKLVGIVTNARMLDQGKELWGKNYYDILVTLITHLLHRDLQVEILIHDASGQDRELAEEVLIKAGSPQVPVINVTDPLVIKKRISSYYLLVGSRYHSLVAALSTSVPVVALGWAHKYKELLAEFGLDEFLILPDLPVEETVNKVDHLLQEKINENCREQISSTLDQMSKINKSMWDSVTNALSTV